ncbi:hypothetical protein ACFPK9_07765 [Rubritalea spongiae]|uniref:Uncharacterized protein n=1 Tax=Rubritalea spongiae TaxID=430797 RepID=A0ABW5E122_9BACT
MSSAEKVPEFADLYLRPSEKEVNDQRERYRQAVRIGFVEMERIVEEVVVPEFEKVGCILIDAGYDVEVVVFDTESSVCDDLFVCGAGLRVSRGHLHSAIVYTGDPYRFEFTLQTHNYAGQINEMDVEYHKLTPDWFHRSVMHFLSQTFSEVDFSEFAQVEEDEWRLMEGPFVVKLEGENGDYETIAEAETIEEAMKMASMFCTAFKSEDKLVLEDCTGRRVC